MENQPFTRYEMVYTPIASLQPAAYNPRKISEDELDKLVRSIRVNGFIDPVIANKDMTIIGGHQRVKAATIVGLKEVPVIFLDISKDAEKALNLALNRIGGDFDEELLSALLLSLPQDQLQNTGFDTDELEDALSKALNPQDDDIENLAPPVAPISKMSDVYIMGDHVLLCGDSTDRAQVDRLMAIPTEAHPKGTRAEMVFTDPPYNVAYTGFTKEKLTIQNDEMSAADFQTFMDKALKNMMAYTDGAFYVCMSSSELAALKGAFEAAGGHWSNFIVWVKNTFTLGRSDWQNRYEPILYGWNKAVVNHYHIGWRNESNVWEDLQAVNPSYDPETNITTINAGDCHLQLKGPVEGVVARASGKTDIWREKKPSRNDVHPTMKPIPLVARAVVASSTSGGVVLDLFLGSGSTIIACEQTGRACRGMELDPAYVDVIVARWEKLTGKKAVCFTGNEVGGLTLD